jgi:lysozyme family protein
MTLFDAAVTNVLQSEGGLVDHPRDPGGLTNMGISLRAYPHLGPDGIRNLTREEAIEIYRQNYWAKVPDALPDGLRWMVFDAAVNHGASRALTWLKTHPTLEAFTAVRLRFYASLSTWDAFGKGWARRVAHVLEGIREWQAATEPAPSAPAEPALEPVRVGAFDVLVLHDWNPKALLAQFDALIAGERTVVLGAAVASTTGDRKLDVRLDA